MSGNTVIDYSLESPGPGQIADPAFLADLSAFADWYRAKPETRHVAVIGDTFRQLNKSMHGEGPQAYRLPGSRADVRAYHLRNIRAMLIGTAVAFLGVSLVLLFALRSLRIGPLSLVPNFVPGLMGFGIWGLAVGEVGLALSVVMAMTIGIVVDDTVHFLSKYRRARLEFGHSPEEAVHNALRTVGGAIFTTTLVLVAGFPILVFSPFVPTASVAKLAALIIGLALVADFLLLAPLLMALDRRRT